MEKLLNKLFETLDDWRNLPAYQLERRADVFFAIYLDEIIKGKFNDLILESVISIETAELLIKTITGEKISLK